MNFQDSRDEKSYEFAWFSAPSDSNAYLRAINIGEHNGKYIMSLFVRAVRRDNVSRL